MPVQSISRHHYKRLWQEEKHAAHMLRRDLANVRARYAVVPGWVVKVCSWFANRKRGVEA